MAYGRTIPGAPPDRGLAILRRPPVLVTLVLGSMFLVLFFYAWSAPLTPDTPMVLDPLRFKAAEEEHVRLELPDPESARFREEFVSEIRPILVVCGEVNQKNHTAGYTGYQRFISGPEFIALESAVGAEIMTQMWSAMCRRKP